MRSRTDSQTTNAYKFAGDNTFILECPLRRYLIDFGEFVDIIEATNMKTSEYGVVFENSIIRGPNGSRVGIGQTFIEHNAIVGVTLVLQEFGGIHIDNDTKLGLFTIGGNNSEDIPM